MIWGFAFFAVVALAAIIVIIVLGLIKISKQVDTTLAAVKDYQKSPTERKLDLEEGGTDHK